MHASLRRLCWPLCLAFLLLAAPAIAEVKPAVLFMDNCVLQRGMEVPVWGTANDGEEVTVEIQGRQAKTVARDGRWMVRLPALDAGGPFTLKIAGTNQLEFKNVLVGEVWICSGQSNMQWTVSHSFEPQTAVAQSANPNIRLINLPRVGNLEPQSTFDTKQKGATWAACGPETVGEFSGVGYFFGRDLQKALDVPVGLIGTNYGGTPAEAWTSPAALEANPALKPALENARRVVAAYPQAIEKFKQEAIPAWKAAAEKAKSAGQPAPRQPFPPPGPTSPVAGSLYNAMIAPLVPYAIRGAIWYQGEANAGRAYQYRTTLPAMIADWRKAFGEPNFTFLVVQLAPFMEIVQEPAESAWAELREAQLLTSQNVPHTGLAVITDVGEEKDIHPKKKAPVGARLALAARALAYGEKIEYSGPIYKSLKIDGNRAIVSFDHLGSGLVAQGGPLEGFTICGADRKFYRAKAEIQGDQVVVTAPEVSQPVAVRYGWANYPVVNLWNEAGLPASPFRTDDFPITTGPKSEK